jgi:hypothetical protein
VLFQVSLYEMALGDETGSHELRADPALPEDTTKRSLYVDGPVVAEVPVRAFDELVRSGELDLARGIDAVKIDVEGAEVRVLAGMRETLERHRPRIVVIETIEGHLNRAGSSVSEVDAFMRDVGYGRMNDDTHRLELNAVFVPI